jgi:hypothetical protein
VAKKRCNTCKRKKLLKEFYKNSLNKDGYANQCKKCKVEYMKGLNARPESKARINVAAKKWRQSDEGKEYHKDFKFRQRYGITLETYKQMALSQENRCAICKEVSDKLVVDHDHETGKVRALLCDSCNTGIGHFKENAVTLKSAAEYVEFHKVHTSERVTPAAVKGSNVEQQAEEEIMQLSKQSEGESEV